MALGLGDVMKLKGAWEEFTRNHPKFPAFLNAAKAKGITEGTIIGIKIVSPDGEAIETNIKVQPDDMRLFETVSKM